MRQFIFLLVAAGSVWSQSMLESAAVVAGTSTGTAAGKKVSDGISATLKKTARPLEQAAKTGAPGKSAAQPAPLLQASPGVLKAEKNNVPPPPPKRVEVRRVAARVATPVPVVLAAVSQVVAPPRPPVDLSTVAAGMAREQLLALGTPSARITMYEDGHLVEIFQYSSARASSDTVRLRDGAVATVNARP
ncbi:MAG: hypothetical protein ABI811_17095 [Acidobacteriota bacterium]